MSPDIIVLSNVVTLKDLLHIMNSCTHNGFPVVRHVKDADRYVGLILRRQLRVILAMKRIEFRSGCEIPDFDTKVFIAMKESHRSKELNIEAHVQHMFTEPFVNQMINLTPFMNRFVHSLLLLIKNDVHDILALLFTAVNVSALAAALFRCTQTSYCPERSSPQQPSLHAATPHIPPAFSLTATLYFEPWAFAICPLLTSATASLA
jgi:CBS domain-containing protein